MSGEHIQWVSEGWGGGGYLAVPEGGSGPGVLVLHAWWGLTPFFTALCDRLAAAGFTALAPDLYGDGATASTLEQAEQLMANRNVERIRATLWGASDHLRQHPATQSRPLGVVGFSMGAAWALIAATDRPADYAAAVLFYGTSGADFASMRASVMGHYADDDAWEPLEDVRHMEADMQAAHLETSFYVYPNTHHWFFESNRLEFDFSAATLAWERTLAFLDKQLGIPTSVM